MHENILAGIILTGYTLLNIVAPLSGSATVTPLLAIITDPHQAIGLASFYFFLVCLVRIVLFRKYIRWNEINHLVVWSAIAALIGSLSLVSLSATVLYVVVFLITVYFLLKRLKVIPEKKTSKLASTSVGVFSGFLQGAGLAGSDLRNSYLFAQGLTVTEVHGTTAVIGAVNFFIATIVRVYTHQISLPDLSPLLFIFPLIVVGTVGGKFLLNKISKKYADHIATGTLVIIVILLAAKVLKLLF